MANPVSISSLLLVLAATLSVTGCVATAGDFNRRAPSALTGQLLPQLGETLSGLQGEPVSTLLVADEEEAMVNRVWRYLTAPHAADWKFNLAVELKASRLSPRLPATSFEVTRYYNYLRKDAYASSRVRFATIAADIDRDIAMLPETFAAICVVQELDRKRAVALAASSLGPVLPVEVADRRIENDNSIAWFVAALRYRYDSYSFALDTLLVETPHQEAREVDWRLGALQLFVAEAMGGRFCAGGGEADPFAGAAIASRYSKWATDDGAVQIK
ncbi:MAG: hypothetical protein JWR75_1982 [Devosia sp.]|nr:hypothetical protein [Devosia sp.]